MANYYLVLRNRITNMCECIPLLQGVKKTGKIEEIDKKTLQYHSKEAYLNSLIAQGKITIPVPLEETDLYIIDVSIYKNEYIVLIYDAIFNKANSLLGHLKPLVSDELNGKKTFTLETLEKIVESFKNDAEFRNRLIPYPMVSKDLKQTLIDSITLFDEEVESTLLTAFNKYSELRNFCVVAYGLDNAVYEDSRLHAKYPGYVFQQTNPHMTIKEANENYVEAKKISR